MPHVYFTLLYFTLVLKGTAAGTINTKLGGDIMLQFMGASRHAMTLDQKIKLRVRVRTEE